jgi:hypothetical protein
MDTDTSKKIQSEFASATSTLKSRYENIEELIEEFPISSELSEEAKESLAVTDLSVENEIVLSTARANEYNKDAKSLFDDAQKVLLIGTILAFAHLAVSLLFSSYGNYPDTGWPDVFLGFFRTVAAYGLLVLLGIAILKQGKAKLGQAEMLYGQMRADQTLRLLLHLKKGQISTEEALAILSLGGKDESSSSTVKEDSKASSGAISGDVSKAASAVKSSLRRSK